MDVYYFTEMPYTAFPESEVDKYPSMRLTFPNTYFNPNTAHDLFKRYLDEYQYAEEVGFEVLDPAQGAIAVKMRDALRNPVGAMQGAIVSLVAELAAETLAEHTRAVPQIVTGLDIRYLAMGRHGPITSRAGWVGYEGSGTIEIELRDRGNEDRIVTQVLAQVENASMPADSRSNS